MNPTVLIGLFALVGIGGICFSRRWVRVVFWLLSIPPLGLGVFGLSQGGIAEPFSSRQMWTFCAATFWPAIGCLLGEVITYWRSKAKRTRKSGGR